MATIDSSIDGSMTVILLDAQETEALKDVLTGRYVDSINGPDVWPAVLDEMYNAL